ncbi:MAG: hypothetical protein MJY82_09085 [Fibrobacter sp.]|nr:hypothetical protein [Fibrobacter sp.]
MKPSPYFADRFKYFFKRFVSEPKLKRWFLQQAGEDSGAFSFPAALQDNPKTLVLLPRDMEGAAVFMHTMPQAWFQNVLLLAHESLHALVSAKRAKAIYYSDKECRYGEPTFNELEGKIAEFAPTVSIYLGEPFLPRLYLLKKSGAGCRIGFNCEDYYPFFNLSLRPENSSPAKLIMQYYGF